MLRSRHNTVSHCMMLSAGLPVCGYIVSSRDTECPPGSAVISTLSKGCGDPI